MKDDTAPRQTMLITGATGFIGTHLAARAHEHGHRVRTLTRSDWDGRPPVPLERRYYGALPDHVPPEALDGVDIVVHCAADLGTDERSARAINVRGTLRLAEMARDAGVSTFIFLSSQSARVDAISAYGRTKYAAEQGLADLGWPNVVILRPGLVTGPGGHGLFHRMSRLVERLPVIPLLGGGRALVQPIHVDDLCTAIIRCAEMGPALYGTTLSLGDPQGVTLARLLQLIALAQTGRRKPLLPIPLWPISLAIRVAEVLRVPLPINRNNLQGMQTVQRMETAPALQRLGVALRPPDEAVRHERMDGGGPLPMGQRSVRMLLVGAGRIGLVHAVTLSRLRGAVLAGIVDPNRRATGLLHGMGIRSPAYRTLDEALRAAAPDAAVIATPAWTHPSLARACLEARLVVMVEKPLAVEEGQLAGYRALQDEFPTQPIQVGYVMLRNPQVATLIERLRAGELGQVRGFVGLTLLSFVHEASTARWEVDKARSGGGALINSGGHVLSMIQAALGDPASLAAQSLRRYSTAVEDSIVTVFEYPGFQGVHYCSWAVEGFPRQENTLVIHTDRGRLILTGSTGVFLAADGAVDLRHQLDFDAGFNLAPDYAGAGFSIELAELRDAARTRKPGPLGLDQALRLERLLFRVYAAAAETARFQAPDTSGTGAPPERSLRPGTSNSAAHANPVSRMLDLREVPTGEVQSYLRNGAREEHWEAFQLTVPQIRELRGVDGRCLRVTVPDFLAQSRLLSSGRFGEVLRGMGPRGLGRAALAGLPLLPRERAATFWVAALGLLGAALEVVPTDFAGTLLLHGYLVDFALALRRPEMLQRMLRLCRRRQPGARIGLHTNLAGELLPVMRSLSLPVDEISFLSSPSARDMAAIVAGLRDTAGAQRLRLVAEVGLAPAAVHRLANKEPGAWAHGADALLIGSAAEPALARHRESTIAREWRQAFPGTELPEGVL